MTFTGVGFDRRVMGDTMPVTDQQDLTGVPGVQSVSVPGQVREAYIHNYPFLFIIIVKNIYIHSMKSHCSTLFYIILMFDFLYLQLMYLSQERLSFGNLPLFSRARRMVFVTNKAKDRDVSFEWHVTSQADAQVSSTSCP